MNKIFLLIALFCFTNVHAQKLANVQQTSLRAPGNIKVDGKATEWDNKFQAYNKATEVFYTLSNDNENLYLTVQATRPRIIEKIIAVGVTLIINTEGEQNVKAKGNKAFIFPLLSVPDGQRIIAISGIKTKNATIEVALNKAEGITTIVKQSDSVITAANKMLISKANAIKTIGISNVPDTISIYNEYKIKAAAAFDGNSAYTYELAVPLKTLGLLSGAQKFSYGIQLKSRLEDMKKGVLMVYRYGPGPNGEQINVNQDLDSTTDFWSNYTLAK